MNARVNVRLCGKHGDGAAECVLCAHTRRRALTGKRIVYKITLEHIIMWFTATFVRVARLIYVGERTAMIAVLNRQR